jgi:hypothetical protein
MKRMEFDIIWINGMPRSGTSWLSQIFDSSPDVNFKLSPLFSYAFKNAVGITSTPDEWIDFFKAVYISDDSFLNQTERRTKGEYPVFEYKKSKPPKLVIKDTRYHNLTNRLLDIFHNIKFVHIIRNPCGAINSWLRAPREFPPESDIFSNWKTGLVRKTGPEEFWGYKDWKKLTKMYTDLEERFPEKVVTLRYEDLVNDAIRTTERLFKFCDLRMEKQTLDFVKHSQANDVKCEYAVFKPKSVKDKWKYELEKVIIDEISNDLKSTELEFYLGE